MWGTFVFGCCSVVRLLSDSVAGLLLLFSVHLDFELPGRAEMSRLVLIYAGIKFEDNRVSGGEWQTMKSDVKPWHQLPIIEADGRTISQSNAILRYVGRIAGLIPADPFDEAKVNELVDGLEEVIAVFIPTFGISGERNSDICFLIQLNIQILANVVWAQIKRCRR